MGRHVHSSRVSRFARNHPQRVGNDAARRRASACRRIGRSLGLGRGCSVRCRVRLDAARSTPCSPVARQGGSLGCRRWIRRTRARATERPVAGRGTDLIPMGSGGACTLPWRTLRRSRRAPGYSYFPLLSRSRRPLYIPASRTVRRPCAIVRSGGGRVRTTTHDATARNLTLVGADGRAVVRSLRSLYSVRLQVNPDVIRIRDGRSRGCGLYMIGIYLDHARPRRPPR